MSLAKFSARQTPSLWSQTGQNWIFFYSGGVIFFKFSVPATPDSMRAPVPQRGHPEKWYRHRTTPWSRSPFHGATPRHPHDPNAVYLHPGAAPGAWRSRRDLANWSWASFRLIIASNSPDSASVAPSLRPLRPSSLRRERRANHRENRKSSFKKKRKKMKKKKKNLLLQSLASLLL